MFLRLFKYLWPERYLPEALTGDPFDENPALRADRNVGVLLVNLGTPAQPERQAIRQFLREFLSDPRVIEIPRYLWLPILHGLVLLLRPKKLEPRYAGIWLPEGSPLKVYSERQAEGLRLRLQQRGVRAEVELGMRYGAPTIEHAIQRLRQRGCEHILTLPLYPQFAASTTATVVDALTRYAARLRDQPELRFVKRFFADSAYLHALAAHIETYWRQHGRPQKLVMSFHGLPRYSIELGDPYYQDCLQTVRMLSARLSLDPTQIELTFQSRFGSARWLEPYTEPTLKMLAALGVTEVDVICPGFVTDCLETLEEINQECRDAFLAAGGKQFRYIAALNDNPLWLDGLTTLVERHLQGWPTTMS